MRQFTNWANLALGMWLVVAPVAMGYHVASATARLEEVLLGVLIAGCSLWLALEPTAPPAVSVLVGLSGLWVAIAPFVLRYVALRPAATNDIGVGILIAVLIVASALEAI